MKGARLYTEGEVQDTQDIALNNKNAVLHKDDLTQSPIASNTQETALNTQNPVLDENVLTQSPFKALEKWGTTAKPPPVSWTVHHMFQADAANYIAGEPGVGKSWIMCDLAVSVATGTPFMERRTQQGPVLIINWDDTESLPRQYAEKAARGRGYALEDLPLYYWEPNQDEAKPLNGIADADVFAELTFQVKELQPKLIIVDSFSSAFPSLKGNEGPDIVRGHEVLRMLRINSPGASVVLIDHTPKEVVLQSKRRGVSGSQQKNAQVRSGHIVSHVEPSEVGGEDVLRWDFHKINGAPPQKSFAIDREQTAEIARLSVRDLPERERAPKATQSLEAALEIIRGAGDAGIARTELIERVATITNVGQRTIEGVIDKEVRPHPNVLEKRLPGRGSPKGYKWRGIGEEGDGSGGAGDSAQSAADLTQSDDLTQTPVALNHPREARENAISRNDAKHPRETPLREKEQPFWPTGAEHPYILEVDRLEYLKAALMHAARRGRRFTAPLPARAEARRLYLDACTDQDCVELRLKPDTADADELRVEAMTLFGAARELQVTGQTDFLGWAEVAEEVIRQRGRPN